MACCDWQTFEDSFLYSWRRKNVGELLIDWVKAKRDWKRYHCTGGEAASMQLCKLYREADYLWLSPRPNRGDDDGGGGAVVVPRQPVLC